MEETKMYDAKKAKEGKDKTQLPPDTILDGVIKAITDGKVNQFIHPNIEWKGDKDSPAINLTFEVKNGEEFVEVEQLFTYKFDMGQTIYTPKSNLGKYQKKYGKLPEVGDQIKVIVNSDGFGKVKLD